MVKGQMYRRNYVESEDLSSFYRTTFVFSGFLFLTHFYQWWSGLAGAPKLHDVMLLSSGWETALGLLFSDWPKARRVFPLTEMICIRGVHCVPL